MSNRLCTHTIPCCSQGCIYFRFPMICTHEETKKSNKNSPRKLTSKDFFDEKGKTLKFPKWCPLELESDNKWHFTDEELLEVCEKIIERGHAKTPGNFIKKIVYQFNKEKK